MALLMPIVYYFVAMYTYMFHKNDVIILFVNMHERFFFGIFQLITIACWLFKH